MEEKFLQLLLKSGLSEKEKLEVIFNKYIDIDSGAVILNIDQFDRLLDDIMQFYNRQ